MIVPPDPAPQFDAGSVSEKSSLRVLLQPRLLVLFALIFLGNGYFNAIFTWLEPLLGANGIDAEHAGLIALAMLIGGVAGMAAVPAWPRSEEHTSELQSLMRISYAVFCLKKKKREQHSLTTNIASMC